MTFVLASASPRRRQILTDIGAAFEVVIPDVEERREGDPAEVVVENALRKARAGRDLVGGAGEGTLVLGVDTDVALDGRLLGKPDDEAGARERLGALAGRTHDVLSGVALLGAEERTALARSTVTFNALSESEIDRYVRSGEWRDRAGGYAIQGLGSTLVASLHGDFSNVVGLPLQTLLDLEPGLLR